MPHTVACCGSCLPVKSEWTRPGPLGGLGPGGNFGRVSSSCFVGQKAPFLVSVIHFAPDLTGNLVAQVSRKVFWTERRRVASAHTSDSNPVMVWDISAPDPVTLVTVHLVVLRVGARTLRVSVRVSGPSASTQSWSFKLPPCAVR